MEAKAAFPPTPLFFGINHPLQTLPPPLFIVFRRCSRPKKAEKELDTVPRDRYRYSYRLENSFYLQIQPYIHNYCNNMADKDQLTAITFPDVDPNMLPEDSKQVFFTLSDLFIYFNIYIYASIGMISFFLLLTSTTSVRNLKREQFFNLFLLFRCIEQRANNNRGMGG
jgi:hypothetical protein